MTDSDSDETVDSPPEPLYPEVIPVFEGQVIFRGDYQTETREDTVRTLTPEGLSTVEIGGEATESDDSREDQ